jgi:hypothetical protein
MVRSRICKNFLEGGEMKTNKVSIEIVENGYILRFNSVADSILKTEYNPRKTEIFVDISYAFNRISTLFKEMRGE